MKTELICRNVKRKAVLASLTKGGWRGLVQDPRVARVQLNALYGPNASPPFRVSGRLVVAGPDVGAVGEGQTLDAAIHLVIRQLERGLLQRHHHQELNRHNRLQTPKATRDRFLRVLAGTPSPRCPASFRRQRPYDYVMF